MANKFESPAKADNHNLKGQQKNFLDSPQLNNFLCNSNIRLPVSYQSKFQQMSKSAKLQRFQQGSIFQWLKRACQQKAQALAIAFCLVPVLLIGGAIYRQTDQSLTQKISQIPITSTTDQIQKVKDLVAHTPFEKPENDWQAVIAAPVAIAFQAKRDILLTLLLGTGGIASLAGVMGAVVVGRLREQAEELTTVGSDLAQANDQVEILLKERKCYREQLQLLADVATIASKAEDRTYIFDQAVRGAKQWLGVERVVVYGFESDSQGSIIAEAVAPGWSQALTKQITDSCIPGKILEDYRKGRVATINDISATNYSPEHLQLLDQLEVKSSLVVPIVLNNNLLGLLIAHQCTRTRLWEHSEISFLQLLAIQVGLSLTSLTLAAQKKAEAVRYFQLDAITAHFRQSLDLEDIYNIAITRVRETLKTDRVFVYLFDENWQGTIIAEAVGQEWPKMFGLNIADPCFVKYVEQYKRGRVVAVENIHQAGLSDCYLEQLAPFQVKAYLVAPLLRCGNLHALLVTHQCCHGRSWQESEITFFKQVAVLVSYALDQAAFLEEREQACLIAEAISQEQRRQVEQMSSLMQEVTQKVQEVVVISRAASDTAAVGEIAMEQSLEKMLSLREMVASTTSKVKHLGESSQQIAKVTSIINQIARQTHSVTIDTGLESEPESKGFTIIAEEVSKLAARSSGATQKIEEIVTSIQLETSQVVETLEKSLSEVVAGTQLVECAKRSLEQTVEASMLIDQLVRSISEVSISQSQTSQVVSKLMYEIALMSARTSGSSQQISSSLKQTVEVAQELPASVRTFNVTPEN